MYNFICLFSCKCQPIIITISVYYTIFLLISLLYANKDIHYVIVKNKATHILQLTSLNSNNQVDAIYIDFQKAFDSVIFTKLLHKLTAIGLPPFLISWTAAFIANDFTSICRALSFCTFTCA